MLTALFGLSQVAMIDWEPHLPKSTHSSYTHAEVSSEVDALSSPYMLLWTCLLLTIPLKMVSVTVLSTRSVSSSAPPKTCCWAAAEDVILNGRSFPSVQRTRCRVTGLVFNWTGWEIILGLNHDLNSLEFCLPAFQTRRASSSVSSPTSSILAGLLLLYFLSSWIRQRLSLPYLRYDFQVKLTHYHCAH